MSTDGVVQEVSAALAAARGLFGRAPAAPVWTSTDELRAGHHAVARAHGAAQSWRGAGASGYLSVGGPAALGATIGADMATGAGLRAGATAARTGRDGMNTIIAVARQGISALASSTDAPAGRAQLIAHLQHQLRRAKALLLASERRNIELAATIHAGARGYRAVGGAPVRAATVPDAARECPAAQTAVKAALSRLGRPYVWGAKGPDAFDCSGLVRWSWAQAGVTLAGDTYHQIEQGLPVAPADVRAGDLIFPTDAFGEDGCPGPGHVMLAISPTQCVEAQQAGVPVKISPMPAGFVARRPQ